jgi:hypothetical protein
MIFGRALAALLMCVSFSGCVPVGMQYQRAEAPGAVYLRGLCGGSGAPNWAYYPFHGIFISVSPRPMSVGLHYPPGTTAQLDANEVTLSGWRQNELFTLTIHLAPADHRAMGNSTPEEFDAMVDPMNPNAKIYTSRSSKGRGLIWANFIGVNVDNPHHVVIVPEDLDRAKIVIPAITINGEVYGPQELPIVHKQYVGVIPVNC